MKKQVAASSIESIQQRLQLVLGKRPVRFLLVDVDKQELSIIHNGTTGKTYSISTSRFGIGNRRNSCKTPPGIHRIAERYGAGAPLGLIFKDRKDTGRNWKPGDAPRDYVLTRILRLQGLEPGINKGPGIDSYKRFIYIHGTSHENEVGTPLSHGCVVMKNRQVVDLFGRTRVGTIVAIA
jgi:lipoprotein-anchoring transpeptidase ErfK/SrfK